jgi:hypothetical protein
MTVNVATLESNLTVSSMPRGGDVGGSIVHAGENFIDDLKAKRQGREVFALFILLAMAALVAESILSRRG